MVGDCFARVCGLLCWVVNSVVADASTLSLFVNFVWWFGLVVLTILFVVVSLWFELIGALYWW